MRLSKIVFGLGLAVLSCGIVAISASAAHDPCKVLTAEAFSKIMGYTATISKNGSTEMACVYVGAKDSGGQFRIMTEVASGPQVDAMLTRRGSSPPAGSGLIGGTYREGTIIFSVSIKSTDQAKVQALVTEIRRNLS